mgnify:CR=1 FL=1
MNLFLRAMISLDLPEVAAIDRSARDPLPLRRLREWLHFAPPRPRIGLVAECRDPGPLEYAPVGFALYTVRRGRLTLDRLAVRPDCRRQGVGRRLVADVQRQLLGPRHAPTARVRGCRGWRGGSRHAPCR